jgi:hypothetical protein
MWLRICQLVLQMPALCYRIKPFERLNVELGFSATARTKGVGRCLAFRTLYLTICAFVKMVTASRHKNR